MPSQLKLSELIAEIDEAIHYRFTGETFWITAEITDVKKMPDKRWCFLKFIEKEGNFIIAEMKAVFWSHNYTFIEEFEKLTKQIFANGLEITCEVKIRFHARYGLDVEVLAIDHSYSVGKIILEKEKTLLRLITENPSIVQLIDGEYLTYNQQLALPLVMQKIALITAPNSDGQRDFVQEMQNNQYGYAFKIDIYATTVQGESAVANMLKELKQIHIIQQQYDAVAIVRGGGSQIDFAPFEDYELAKMVAGFPLPIFTGIGHDSNTSIVDMMARHLKTPTKVAANIVEHNFYFENEIMQLHDKMNLAIENKLYHAKMQLQQIKSTIKAYSPESILAKGYAIITKNNKIITNPAALNINDKIEIVLQSEKIKSIINGKEKNNTEL
ncbi:MAG: exodeoxyribonuclease large subunit [Bacteroidota bacterium]|jgi:exodeoxyribonuclease VII large subunit